MNAIRNYYDLLKQRAQLHPQKQFLCLDETHWSYREALARADAISASLPPGVAGDVLVLAEDFLDQASAFFALQAGNVRPILLHHGLSAGELEDILRTNALQGLLSVGKHGIEYRAATTPARNHGEKDILGVLSSGSTGTPKVMYRTYESWAGFFPVQNEVFGVSGDTRLFLHGSLSFTGNLNSFLSVLYEGGTVVTSRKTRCRTWENLLRSEKANVIYLVPAKLRLLLDALRQPVTSVDSVFTGSQLLSENLLKKMMVVFCSPRIILYYGASELNYITYAVCDDPKRDPANLGRPFPGIRVSVRDGLVYVDTPYHVSGVEIPFTVKDTGFLNEAGELIFQGRREAWINKGGVKISMARIEKKLLELDGIKEAAILRHEDEKRGSDFAAFLVKESGAEERAIRQSIRHHLNAVEIPSRIFFLDELPLNDRGKIDRRKLEGEHHFLAYSHER